MLRSDFDLLHHIQEEINFILDHTPNKSLEDILDDAVLYRAVVRGLEIIGEATKKLSNDFKASYPAIEWKKMAATRDKLIHDYFGVDFEIVFDIIKNKLPPLQIAIADIINGASID